jgi:hypothetical protein
MRETVDVEEEIKSFVRDHLPAHESGTGDDNLQTVRCFFMKRRG